MGKLLLSLVFIGAGLVGVAAALHVSTKKQNDEILTDKSGDVAEIEPTPSTSINDSLPPQVESDVTIATRTVPVKKIEPIKEIAQLVQNLKTPVEETYNVRPFVEITRPAGFVNTGGAPITIADYVGEKVILVYVMTYSCINCQRTVPFVNNWYQKYQDDGLQVIGIHTPEFSFEKDIDNVTEAMKKNHITFPVVLDNEYGTWRALGNRFWPRMYLIDKAGNIVYDHIGEGDYQETEQKIVTLLDEL